MTNPVGPGRVIAEKDQVPDPGRARDLLCGAVLRGGQVGDFDSGPGVQPLHQLGAVKLGRVGIGGGRLGP